MATVLRNYQDLRGKVETRMRNEDITAPMLWWYGELVYRIGVLETLQAYNNFAPPVMEIPTLASHYQMLDAYIQSLTLDRRYGPDRGPDTQKERDAASQSLERIVGDYRKRFASFAPKTTESYWEEVTRVIRSVLPAWLQVRDTYVPLKTVPKENGEENPS